MENTKEEIIIKNFDSVIAGIEPYASNFYEQYDRMIWDISRKWHTAIHALSKGQLEINDTHNEIWAYIYANIDKYDKTRASLGSWIHIVAESKIAMIKRSLETKKNNRMANEVNYSINSISPGVTEGDRPVDILSIINDEQKIEDVVALQEFLLDYIYSLLELIDACTDKERKVYLLKIQGKNSTEIAEEANVSKSYIPKVYKRLSKKFKALYDSLYEQTYIDKEERDALAKDLLSKVPIADICNKYDLEEETVKICIEMLNIIGIR